MKLRLRALWAVCLSVIVSNQAFAVLPESDKSPSLPLEPVIHELVKDYVSALLYVPQTVAMPLEASLAQEAAPMDEATDADTPLLPSTVESPGKAAPNRMLRFLKPVRNAVVSSVFGNRWGKMHKGIDMAASTGTPIMAAEDGKVVYSGWQNGYGNFVAIDHGAGYVSRYAHSSKLLVKNGQAVNQGQRIALVGNTGRSTGPHLHFEVTSKGIPQNPANLINKMLSIASAG